MLSCQTTRQFLLSLLRPDAENAGSSGPSKVNASVLTLPHAIISPHLGHLYPLHASIRCFASAPRGDIRHYQIILGVEYWRANVNDTLVT
jgi:hypothetical protein